MTFSPREQVPLAPWTTLQVGGPARFFAEIEDEDTLVDALAWARERSLRTVILGGGSNLLVADRGLDALVIRLRLLGMRWTADHHRVYVTASAGEPWDEVVAYAVGRDLAGIECLSGIPGDTGATPIQNVGAYGQEVGDTLVSVRAVERATGQVVELDRAACELGYRDSIFKHRARDAYVITAVRFALIQRGAPALRYAELAQRFAGAAEPPSLDDVRDAVIALRRSKSMVLDAADENGKSAGSFFTNPTLDSAAVPAVIARVEAAGALRPGEKMPSYPAGEGKTKLSAAWLIERAGFSRGFGEGRAGLSTKHTLSIVNRDGASAADILALAKQIRDGVAERFGVWLHPEPVMEGFTDEELRAVGAR
ncbi:MAG: UDP-N-acetylmuramate dehydrogenase [Byssovorax sp.]